MPIREVKLGDICTIKGGYAFKSSEFTKSGIPVVKIANIVGREIDFNEDSSFLSPANLEQYREYVVNKGDILVALSGATTGKFGIYKLDEIALLNQRVAKIVPKNEQVCPKYLFYYMDKLQNKILQKAGGAAQPNISPKEIAQFTIPLPSIEIQNRISEILDKAQELIDKRKAQIEALDQLTQSVFLEMFGNLKGEKVPLSELCYINPSKKEIENIDKELPVTFLPMANVSENGELDLSETRLIKEVFEGFTYFREGDVLFAKITPCMENGKGAIARNLINNIGFGSTEFHVLRPKENVNSTWLYYLTSLQSFRKQAEANMTGSAGQKRVPKQFFSKYKVVLPPIELQNQFAEIVHKIQSQKEIMKKSLEELENNFNSLMQRAFKGELFND